MEIEHGGVSLASEKTYTDGKSRPRVKRYARTPGGANLGERVIRNGCPYLKHKDGDKYEELSPETVVECISGRKVDHIVYMTAETELVAER